jgi:hypothetical protein
MMRALGVAFEKESTEVKCIGGLGVVEFNAEGVERVEKGGQVIKKKV